jgi:Flp pilus assembly protein TadD
LAEVAAGYQRMLEQNPCEPEALVGISLVALASRQPDAAIKMASAAVDAAPRMGTAWVALGQALKAADRCEEAENAYGQAIQPGRHERAGSDGPGRAEDSDRAR